MRHNIACVVVTYNRKKMLINCLDAICQQIYKPVAVYIIDNASTDGTGLLLEEMGYKNVTRESINFIYHPLPQNIGGAGGFHEGMKVAYETNSYDAYWVMDDDGCPVSNCLENLIHYIGEYAYIAPIVLDIEDSMHLSFDYSNRTIDDIYDKYGHAGIIKNRANPFNGILYRNDLVEKIGFPKKDMFIWGDECEYDQRAILNRYCPVTIINAVHKHPKSRLMLYDDILGRKSIIFTESSLRNYCYYRNRTYIIKKYKSKIKLCLSIIKYVLFFMVQRKFDIKNMKLFMSAVDEALWCKDFKGHIRYM